jgi:transposase
VPSPKLVPLLLSAGERASLEALARKRTASQSLAERARIVLACARFHLHLTPTSSSWLNFVERWFAELTNRKLRRSAHRSVTELEDDIRRSINEWNNNPRPFTWTKPAGDILETLAAYRQRISGAG